MGRSGYRPGGSPGPSFATSKPFPEEHRPAACLNYAPSSASHASRVRRARPSGLLLGLSLQPLQLANTRLVFTSPRLRPSRLPRGGHFLPTLSNAHALAGRVDLNQRNQPFRYLEHTDINSLLVSSRLRVISESGLPLKADMRRFLSSCPRTSQQQSH